MLGFGIEHAMSSSADFFANWNTFVSIQNISRGRLNHIVLKSANVGILSSRQPLGNSNVCWQQMAENLCDHFRTSISSCI